MSKENAKKVTKQDIYTTDAFLAVLEATKDFLTKEVYEAAHQQATEELAKKLDEIAEEHPNN